VSTATANTEPAAERIAANALRIKSGSDTTGLHFIELFGELDIASAEALTDELRRVESTSARQILVDLSAVHFIDSRGIMALVAAQERSSADGGRLCYLRPAAPVERVLSLTGFDSKLVFLD
jgi:anti-sigma B factor antagonist